MTTVKAYFLMPVAILLLLAIFAGAVSAQDAPLPAPTGIAANNGNAIGEAIVSWDTVPGAAFYRIGWVALPDYQATVADGRDWLEAFHFLDIANTRQTQWTLSRLTPGVQYAFIVASNDARHGNPQYGNWSELITLTPESETKPPVSPKDYDADNDGLIEITSLAQLDAIRHDLDGDGVATHPDYEAAFPNAMPSMGCARYPDYLPSKCKGYVLTADLDFDTNGNGRPDAGDAYWNDGKGWLPIGDPETESGYKATFVGYRHTIANLFINRTDTDYIGLFRATDGPAIFSKWTWLGSGYPARTG